jgi:transcription elongation factor GreB
MKTNLVMRGGMEILQEELRFLWHEERPEITQKSHDPLILKTV